MTKPRFEPPVLRWIGVVVALALAGLGLGLWVMSMGGLAATLVAEALMLFCEQRSLAEICNSIEPPE